MRQISDEGRREIAKELREQFYCCRHAEEFTEGLYDVLDLDHCEDGEPIVRVELDTSVELDVSVNGSCGETVGADVTATAYIEDIKYCPFCGEEL